MITYNHEQYIEQAVRSVMMQETDFEYELVIGEDCSTDRTREILLRLVEEYHNTHRIRLILNEKNYGVGKNFYNLYHQCYGEYVAFLEGDDYWTDPNKLQIQANLLDAEQQDVVLCSHPVYVWLEAEQRISHAYGLLPKKYYGIQDMLSRDAKFPHIASVLIRKSKLPELPAEIQTFTFVDRMFFFLCAEKGKFAHIDYYMSVYRVHRGGVYSGADSLSNTLNLIKVYEYLDRRYKPQYRFQSQLGRYWLQLSWLYKTNGKRSEAKRALLRALFYRAYCDSGIKQFVLNFIIIFSPDFILNTYRSLKSKVKHLLTHLSEIRS